MKRVATCIVEVRDARVTNYRGNYEAYLYSVNKEIDDGERERDLRLAKVPPSMTAPLKAAPKPAGRSDREVRKEINNVEKTIARLDEQKRELNGQLLAATDPAEALRLHNEVTALATQLSAAEERWCALQEEVT
jgi:ATP-binding cassette subfamily F protein 3